MNNEKKINPMSFVPKKDLYDELHRLSHEQERSLNYVINKALRKQFGLK